MKTTERFFFPGRLQTSTSPPWWLFLSRFLYGAGSNSKKPMSSPLPSPRPMDEDESGMRRSSLNSSLSSSSPSSSYSFASGATYVTNAWNRMVRDSQFSRWTVSTVRSAYRRSQHLFQASLIYSLDILEKMSIIVFMRCFFLLIGLDQTLQSSQSQWRMAPPSTTSTAKEKDELARVTVDGGVGTSTSKSKLTDAPNEGRVNRKLITTPLSSVSAPMSSSSRFSFLLLLLKSRVIISHVWSVFLKCACNTFFCHPSL